MAWVGLGWIGDLTYTIVVRGVVGAGAGGGGGVSHCGGGCVVVGVVHIVVVCRYKSTVLGLLVCDCEGRVVEGLLSRFVCICFKGHGRYVCMVWVYYFTGKQKTEIWEPSLLQISHIASPFPNLWLGTEAKCS